MFLYSRAEEFLEEGSMSHEALAYLLAEVTQFSVSVTSRALEGAPLPEEQSDILMKALRAIEDRKGARNFFYQMQRGA